MVAKASAHVLVLYFETGFTPEELRSALDEALANRGLRTPPAPDPELDLITKQCVACKQRFPLGTYPRYSGKHSLWVCEPCSERFRVCSTCTRLLILDDFSGRERRCKACCRERSLRYSQRKRIETRQRVLELCNQSNGQNRAGH